MRGLDWPDVRAVLDELRLKYETTPYGFTVRKPFDSSEDWRVRPGSGIAGRGGFWTLVRVNTGAPFSRPAWTRAGLRRAICEHLAGQHPDIMHRDDYYATRHRTRYQSGHFVWKRKPRRSK